MAKPIFMSIVSLSVDEILLSKDINGLEGYGNKHINLVFTGCTFRISG